VFQNFPDQKSISDSVAVLGWRREGIDWRLVRASGSVFGLLGLAADDLLSGRASWADALDDANVFAAIQSAALDQDSLVLRHDVRRADGSRLAVVDRIAVERATDGRPIAFTSTLASVADAGRRARGVDLLAYVSHEVRTPLTGILGLTETLSRSPLTLDQRRMVRALGDAGTALMQIVNNMLEMSRIEAGALRSTAVAFRLGVLCESVVDLFGRAAPADGPRLSIRGQHMDIAVVGDAPKLRQVLGNLVMNALKFTRCGSVEVEWRCAPTGRDGRIRASIAVRDTGPGMDEATVARLFRPFAQSELGAAAGGAGLGLAISRILVEAMDGRIWCESAPGVGSTFHVELPLSAAREQLEREDDGASLAVLEARIAAAAPTLLIAEDCDANRHLLSAVLQPLNARLHFAGDGVEALSAARRMRFDAILMDSRMPRMSGLDATAALRRLEARRGAAHMPVIGFSADSEATAKAAFEAAGADGHVAKPFTTLQLLRALERALFDGPARPGVDDMRATGT
jgi:signal transduction histidine kinase/ActR/RegA family two-component response regulator